MSEVISKTVRFSDVPTTWYVFTDDVDQSDRVGWWAIDALRFKTRGDKLSKKLKFSPVVNKLTAQEEILLVAVERNQDKLVMMKKMMTGIHFYRMLFSSMLNSPTFEHIKANILKHKHLLIHLVDRQEEAIQGINILIVTRGFLRHMSPSIFNVLYDNNIIDQDNVFAWYERKFENEHNAYFHKFGKCLITPFIVRLLFEEQGFR